MEIVEVVNKRLLRSFIDFPSRLYRDDPNYVPDLYISQKKMLTRQNPFFEHSDAKLYLAMENRKIAGRIAAIHNTIHNRIFNDKTAFFGFFEVVENYATAASLIRRVTEWAKSKGFNRLMGPTNFTTNDSCGFLISGFEKMPAIHMPYNKWYYPHYFERYGFRKEQDLFAYEITSQNLKKNINEHLLKTIEQRLVHEGIKIRSVRFKDMDSEKIKLMEVYNASNSENWGFIPLTQNEFESMATDLKRLIPEKLILFAEKDEKEVVGFLVALPDYNQVFRHISSGRLLPFGIFKFLWYRRKIDNSRVLILGVMKNFKNRGIDILLYKKIQENLDSLGIYKGEASYVMENNVTMNSIIHRIGGTVEKKYRIFSMDLLDKSMEEK